MNTKIKFTTEIKDSEENVIAKLERGYCGSGYIVNIFLYCEQARELVFSERIITNDKQEAQKYYEEHIAKII